MAASDQTYRNQKMLDVVFAVSGLLMLLSIVGMFAQDYFREFKTEQRAFRDVEAAMAERALLALMPNDRLDALRDAEAQAKNDPALAPKRQEMYATRKKLHDARDELINLRLQSELKREMDAGKPKEQREQEDKGLDDKVNTQKQEVADRTKDLDAILNDENTPEPVRGVLKAENNLLDYLDRFRDAKKAVLDARLAAKEQAEKKEADILKAQVKLAQADASYRSIKAQYDSKESLYNIAVDERDHTPKDRQKDLQPHLDALKTELDGLRQQRDDANVAFDDAKDNLHQAELDKALAEKVQTQAEADAKKLQEDVERYEKLVNQKRWKLTDWILEQPVLDAFASPLKIQQYTLAELPIDYNFKYVTRYDRCTTCHEGLERAAYDKDALHGLVRPSGDLQKNLSRFRQVLDDRLKRGEDVHLDVNRRKGEVGGFDLTDLPTQVMALPASELTDARITQFCAHPRLDLFVDSNSPHPAEKFGCTSCHSGQGSATDFKFAAHTPNGPHQKEEWIDDHGWFPSHFWDFPMYPKRFEESACLKCHHQVTDLVRYGNQVEAPKLVRGYDLVRNYGCFGCHEIAGLKRGREIGPDLRLEPNVPLARMAPAERARQEADRDNPPGTMRKVGPSLFRLAEKVPEDWVARWVWSPRGFRPSTRMPHFYGLSNNTPHALEGTDQGDFPPTEVRAIAHYLIHESEEYLDGNDAYRRSNRAIVKYYEALQKRQGPLGDSEKKEMNAAEERLAAVEDGSSIEVPLELLHLGKNDTPRHITDQIVDGEGRTVRLPEEPKDEAGRAKERERGRRLFSERGCLACHQHEGTTKGGTDAVPNVVSTADFGPDLSHVAAKLGGPRAPARTWLIQWVLNPQVHHPRTRMPYTHLTADEAAAVAAWLLSEGKDWKGEEPPVPDDELQTLKDLAQLYMLKLRNPDEVHAILQIHSKDPAAEERARTAEERAHVWLDGLRPDADEAILQGELTKDKLQRYVGRKAISRYGCFGCHNVPGFETSKPIGTPLNDWGKKDPERLAFEDIVAYVQDHHRIVPEAVTPKELEEKKGRLEQLQERDKGGDNPLSAHERDEMARLKGEVARLDKDKQALWQEKDGKPPYEEFFFDELHHQQRDGFLNQKLREPRSYDYHRQRVWDDRLRMPQFKFNHTTRLKDESDEEYAARADKEEAEAREAVMTFILGLVAEPVPAEYVNHLNPDQLAEVEGRKLVEQFNCVGCHEIRPGIYQFKPTPEALQRLQDSYTAAASSSANFASDYGAGKAPIHSFLADNAWLGPAPPWPDRLMASGVGYHVVDIDGKNVPIIKLTEALHFTVKDDQGREVSRELPADSLVRLPAPEELLTRSDTLGGAFPRIMYPYLNKRDSTVYKMDSAGEGNARSVLPPQLFREGERTQPEWLFQFLRDPVVIRPQSYMLLRMPKFNISDEEARAIVNYFNAQNKVGNPGIGLTYPYLKVPEREEDYLRERTQEYKKRLGEAKVKKRAEQLTPLWEQALRDQLADARRSLAAAEEIVKTAKEADAKKAAEQNRDALRKQVESLKAEVDRKDVSRLRREWEDQGVYLADAYRLLTNTASPCLACHQVGDVPAKEAKGPNLRLAHDRLRPGWTERWVANPLRLMQPTIMPQNFQRDKPGQYNDLFEGTPLDQVQAVRDVLLNFPTVTTRPENRYYSGSGGGS
jgi:mono/diheme cytochrome c family protein